jgi:23S rRNA pseudouridine1911/1915/1917 synthase
MEEQILAVSGEDAGTRLDSYLAKALSAAPSRTWVKKIIDNGQVQVNGQLVKAHYKVEENDEIIVDADFSPAIENIYPEEIPLDVIYEDEVLLIVNKPVGMLVHPAKGITTGTLVNALLHYCQKEKGKGLSDVNTAVRPGIVHRLDRETSGILIVAKDNLAHVRIARQFEKHRVCKKYLALVAGHVEFDEGKIDAPLARHPSNFDKKIVDFADSAKAATTFYRVLQRFPLPASLVALYPKSGRTHQLRVHMSYIGHPILGDEKYGSKNTFPRMALHAQSIGFVHPTTKSLVEFSVPAPREFLVPPFPAVSGCAR